MDLKFKVTGSQHNYLWKYSNSSRFYLISHFLWSRKIVKNEYKNIDKSLFFTRSDWYSFLSKKVSVIFNVINIQTENY